MCSYFEMLLLLNKGYFYPSSPKLWYTSEIRTAFIQVSLICCCDYDPSYNKHYSLGDNNKPYSGIFNFQWVWKVTVKTFFIKRDIQLEREQGLKVATDSMTKAIE